MFWRLVLVMSLTNGTEYTHKHQAEYKSQKDCIEVSSLIARKLNAIPKPIEVRRIKMERELIRVA